ncbi:TIGR01621 family pseudouridine synthase [Rheinheimera sp.]|uniref:TIGR01621 family pseudouridine synthase n=1 Tax=Rheinheimera sp. TaxID=1869214 RepID=UPI0027BA931B|nr:TIGR01621 family pseudouridine synthase [Rheinheimera sp.]
MSGQEDAVAAVSAEATFQLVFEHADFVVLNKAAGVSFHSEEGAGLVVQAAALLGYALYPVHRLDKVTSGLIIFARSSDTAAELSALFSAQKIQKYYLALSTGKNTKKQGWVKGDMAPARRGAYKLLSSHDNPAVSYFVSTGFVSAGFATEQETLPARLRLYLIKPFTGKTHQIRVALKSVSAPILGDELYQADPSDRVYLHAYALCFYYKNQDWRFVCAPDSGQYFLTSAVQQQLKSNWAAPWLLDWPLYQKPNWQHKPA